MSFLDRIFRRRRAASEPPKTRLAELSARFPYPLNAVHGGDAEQELLRLRRLLGPTGFCPLIVGSYEDASRLAGSWSDPAETGNPATPPGKEIHVEEWFAKQRATYEKYDPDDEGQMVVHASGTAPTHTLAAGHDFNNKPHDEVFIAILPTADGTTAARFMRFGDWNACPASDVHVALARYWRERFGAEMAVLSCDIVEFTVERPPATDEQAMELAWQHYFYCSDIVEQGVGSVATLAKAVRHSTRWYFWWD